MPHSQGNNIDVLAPRSKFYRGPYGRLCPELPAWSPPGIEENNLDEHFIKFASEFMVEAKDELPADIAANTARRKQLGEEFDSIIPAGYTYFGQFVDHDITFDPTSNLQRQNDPNGLLNFRTPRLDLDNVYGRGVSDQPYLYEHDANGKATGKMLIGQVEGTGLRDLPRNSEGRAIIGDMRNDENSMVSQLQLAFLLAHNTLVDRANALGKPGPFEAARKTLCWLYQWIVWNDFLKRITTEDVHDCALKLEDMCGGRQKWSLGLEDFFKWRNQPYMPVEFSTAAYRFGHSMVRNSYQTNKPHRENTTRFVPLFDNTPGTSGDDLRGFRPVLKENVIQWNWFLEMGSGGPSMPQKARKIDTKLSNALAFLHANPDTDHPENKLAYRNLKKAWIHRLPSGTDMAKICCIEPLPLEEHKMDSLWYYILREAESLSDDDAGQMLGKLGSTIVCATFAGLLKGDPRSYLNIEPCWEPDRDDLLCSGVDNTGDNSWALASIIRIAGLPVTSDDIRGQTDGNFPDTVACIN